MVVASGTTLKHSSNPKNLREVGYPIRDISKKSESWIGFPTRGMHL